MKKLIFLIIPLFCFACSPGMMNKKSVTGLGNNPFAPNGYFRYSDGNAINNAVNDNAAAIAVLQAFDAALSESDITDLGTTVQMQLAEGPFVNGDKILLDSAVQPGDSPQLTAVEVGHATDTTLSRAAAGQLAVEGDNLIRASDVDDTPVNGETAVPVSSNWAYNQVYGAFSLSDDSESFAKLWPFVAGETIAYDQVVYLKTNGATGGSVYLYDANAADADTYPILGKARGAATVGVSVYVKLEGSVVRDDSHSFTYNQDEGKPLWASTTAGGETLTKPVTSGDYQIITGIVLQCDNASSGDYVLNVPFNYVSQAP